MILNVQWEKHGVEMLETTDLYGFSIGSPVLQ